MQTPIYFEWMGLQLQEPMAIITNMMLSLFCLFACLRLRRGSDSAANYWWRLFYVFFGWSTFFGALGHGLFLYFGVYGKFPCWTLGCIANVFAAKGMMSFQGYSRLTRPVEWFIWIKSLLFLVLAISTQKFIFVALDAIVTYLTFTGAFAFVLIKRGLTEMRFMLIGVLILLPSAFIFILKINPHRWLNKDDLSHILMLACIAFFYHGMKVWNNRTTAKLNNV